MSADGKKDDGEGRIVNFGYTNKADQFESQMLMQANPWNIFLSVDLKHQLIKLLQNHGKNELRFPHPKTMRVISGFLTEYANKWERGELPGLEPPKDEGEVEGDERTVDQS